MNRIFTCALLGLAIAALLISGCGRKSVSSTAPVVYTINYDGSADGPNAVTSVQTTGEAFDQKLGKDEYCLKTAEDISIAPPSTYGLRMNGRHYLCTLRAGSGYRWFVLRKEKEISVGADEKKSFEQAAQHFTEFTCQGIPENKWPLQPGATLQATADALGRNGEFGLIVIGAKLKDIQLHTLCKQGEHTLKSWKWKSTLDDGRTVYHFQGGKRGETDTTYMEYNNPESSVGAVQGPFGIGSIYKLVFYNKANGYECIRIAHAAIVRKQ